MTATMIEADRGLAALFDPSSLAVVGASLDLRAAGRAADHNLLTSALSYVSHPRPTATYRSHRARSISL